MPPSPPAAPEPRDPPATQLWLHVAGAAEAALAAVAGFDGVEVALVAARSVRAAYAGPLKLRLTETLPDGLPCDAEALSLPADSLPDAPSAGRPAGPAIIARLSPGEATPARIAALGTGIDGVTVEVGAGERLFAVAGIAELDACARACRAAGLAFGIAGNLEAPDVARLLLLAPDHLGFDPAARLGREGGPADAPLDVHALAMLRELVPRRGEPQTVEDAPLDRLFVRDFILPLSIGAYHAERDARQRVRFTVEAEVRRAAASPRDMRDVVSYDIILETIRMLAGRPHVSFVETLAEEIAATLLLQPRLAAVAVTVEKLDIIDGAVGIRIERRKPL